jgi:hypothetical protein
MQPGLVDLDPGPAALERVPRRAFRFLHAVTIHADLARQLEAVGFTPAERNEGWRLLTQLERPMSVARPVQNATSAAVQRLETEGRDFLRRVAVAARHVAPALVRTLFDGVAPGDSLLRTLPLVLDRVAGLDPVTSDDAARLGEALTVRGLGRDTQERLRGLADRARGVGALAAPPLAVLPLHDWLKDWSEAARTVVTQRADLIRLGLAKKRPAKKSAAAPRTASNDDAEARSRVA